jgi:hypothetical protein
MAIDFDQIDIVAGDMDATLTFSRRLGAASYRMARARPVRRRSGTPHRATGPLNRTCHDGS